MRLRINRIALGFVAVPIAVVIWLLLAALEALLFGTIHWAAIAVGAAALAGALVFGLADRLDIIAEPDSPKSFSLSDDADAPKPPEEDARPIRPR
jgi:hypothetical protein